MENHTTNKLDLSAYLTVRGHHIEKMEPGLDENRHPCLFFAFTGEGLMDDVQTFLSNEARIEPNAFCSARRRLLVIIKTNDNTRHPSY